MTIELSPFTCKDEETSLKVIHDFWLAHNGESQTREESRGDLERWTSPDHRFYLITMEGTAVGFVHLGSRGGACDWLEDLFVLPDFQNRGIGTRAIQLAEEIVRGYSVSMYIEAAARNQRAIALYRRLGYDCLNTITIRKDFPGYDYDVKRRETIWGDSFEIRTTKNLSSES